MKEATPAWGSDKFAELLRRKPGIPGNTTHC